MERRLAWRGPTWRGNLHGEGTYIKTCIVQGREIHENVQRRKIHGERTYMERRVT